MAYNMKDAVAQSSGITDNTQVFGAPSEEAPLPVPYLASAVWNYIQSKILAAYTSIVSSVAGKTGAVILTADDISDASAVGKSVMRAANAAAARTAIGAADTTKLDHITVTQPVDLDAIELRVNQLDAAVVLAGAWSAASGSFPGSGTAQAGASYIVSVAGTVDGVAFAVNDRLLAITDNASASVYANNWLKLDYSDQVLSVNGATGAVVLGGMSALEVASQAEAEAGTSNTVGMTPLRVAQALTALGAVPARLGDAALSVADYNSATTNGFYKAASGATNEPAAINALILVDADDTNNLIQIAMDKASDAIYMRRRAAGTFGSWLRVRWTEAEQDARYAQRASNLSDVANAATAFGNIKQAASDTATGVVELATNAEVQTGTDTARAITPAGLTAKEASATEYRNNTADRILTTDQAWAAGAIVTLTDAATVAVDMGTFLNAQVTLGGNRTLGNPTNTKEGQSGFIKIIQDGTGSRTLSYGTSWEFAGGTAPVLSTAANATDYLFYTVASATSIVASLLKGVA